jgi:prevent-host-death family protein
VNSATVGVRELKARLSTYLRRVQEGVTVTITTRGKPLGQIVPASRLSTAKARVLALTESGLIAWNGRKLRPVPTRARIRGKRSVAEILLENRE